MDCFEQITGFPEASYAETQSRLSVIDGALVSPHSPRRAKVGQLETPSLTELRARVAALPSPQPMGGPTVSWLQADARQLHAHPESADALFQVASQFNLLEMTGPAVRPEHGVTRYAGDPTQGPACAMAAGAATIYRNYLHPVDGQPGRGAGRQVDCLHDLGVLLGNADHEARRSCFKLAVCERLYRWPRRLTRSTA